MEKVAAAINEVLRDAMDGVYAEISRLLKEERARFDEERKRRFYRDREAFEKKIMAVVMANFEKRIKTFHAANTRCFVVGKVGFKEGQKGFHWRTIEHNYQDAQRQQQQGEEVRAGQILIDRYPRIRPKRNKAQQQDAPAQETATTASRDGAD